MLQQHQAARFTPIDKLATEYGIAAVSSSQIKVCGTKPTTE